jgi:DNA-binding MarR family transcriptional regulator
MLMMHLWEAGPQRQVDLVKTFDSDAAVITRTVARLERAGFVRRTPSPTDKRASIIASTTAGDALRAQVEEIWLELETRTVAGLSEQERSETLTVLNRLEKHLIERFTA